MILLRSVHQSMSLAIYLVYGMQIVPRSMFYESDILKKDDRKFGNMPEVIKAIQNRIWDELKPPNYVCPTDCLLDNLLSIVCAICTCTHVLLLGDEWSLDGKNTPGAHRSVFCLSEWTQTDR